METLLTSGEIAKYLRVHVITVYRLVDQGMPQIKVGGQKRFRVSDVMRWVESQGKKAKKK